MAKAEGIAPKMCWEPQGLIAPEIIVDERQIDSPNPVDGCDAVGAFVHLAMERAMLVPGEFPEEALLFNDFSYYYGNVVNGGHSQFVKNAMARDGELDASMLARVERLLDAVGAREHHGVFRDFVAYLGALPESDRHALASTTLGGFPPAFDGFNDRFFSSEEHEDALWERVRQWLRSLPVLRRVPADVLQAEAAALVAANPLRQARIAASEAERAEAEAASPVHVAARSLCSMAGLEFKSLIAGDPRWMPEVFIWSFRTADGRRDMVLKNSRAYLMKEGDWKENGDWTGLSCECVVDFSSFL